jgi:hypothetical protein
LSVRPGRARCRWSWLGRIEIEMPPRASLPPKIVTPLRASRLALLEVIEEPTRVGTCWRIRQQTFAHMAMSNAGLRPRGLLKWSARRVDLALAVRGAGSARLRRASVLSPGWWPNVVGLELEPRSDVIGARRPHCSLTTTCGRHRKNPRPGLGRQADQRGGFVSAAASSQASTRLWRSPYRASRVSSFAPRPRP